VNKAFAIAFLFTSIVVVTDPGELVFGAVQVALLLETKNPFTWFISLPNIQSTSAPALYSVCLSKAIVITVPPFAGPKDGANFAMGSKDRFFVSRKCSDVKGRAI
jgi:hypothetical protein